MEGQKSIFDYGTDPPELWECMRTCKHAGEITGTFPTGEKRCEYGEYQDGNGTSGNDHYQKVDSRSVVHFYCKYYEMR